MLLCLFLTGCSSASSMTEAAENTVSESSKPASSSVSIGEMTLTYDPGKIRIDAMDDHTIAIADISGDGKYTAEISTDSAFLRQHTRPADVTAAQDMLVNDGYIYSSSVYRDSPHYAAVVTADFDTNDNQAYFKIFIVPKSTSEDTCVYRITLCKGSGFTPTETVYSVVKASIDRLLGNSNLFLFEYPTVLKCMQNVYDQANETGDTSASADESSLFTSSAPYIPEERFGTYTLDGSKFSYLTAGNDKADEIATGTYEVSVIKGMGTYNQTGKDLVPKETYQFGGNGNPTTATVTLEEGDRLYLTAGMTISMKKITR